MKPYLLLVLVFFASLLPIRAQRMGVYTFENSLNEESGRFPTLKILGRKGIFTEEAIAELGSKRKFVYEFDKNCGLQIDNKEAQQFFSGSYTIELFFKLDDLGSWKRVIDFKNRKSDFGCYIYDGKLNFYNFALGEKAPVRAGKYTHYVMSRDAATKQIKMYVDGESKVLFSDRGDHATLDGDQVINFFYDDLEVKDEASSGTLALMRIYDYVVEPVAVKQNFTKLATTINLATPKVVTNLPKELPKPKETETPKPKIIELPNKPYEIALKAWNSKSKQPVSNAILLVLDSNMVENLHTDMVAGATMLKVQPQKEYNLIVEAAGYLPTAINFSAQKLANLKETGHTFWLDPIEIGAKVVLKDLFFDQSKAEILPESRLELNKILAFMRDNPKVEIELYGHTDNQGDFDLNIQLSKQRVEVIKSFLVKNGIATGRIIGRGFGASRPIANNAREETRRMNRRVELVISKY